MSVAVAATIALGTAGCGFMTPQSTTEHYDASDGVSVTVGKVDVRNAILFTDDGESARFVATLVNNSDSRKVVTIQAKGKNSDETDVTVPANSSLDLAKDSDAVVFDRLGSKAGVLTRVFFTYPSAEGASIRVPVLTGALEEYKTLLPTPSSTATVPATDPTLTPAPYTDATPSESATPAAG
ncbi:hypothetical protein [Curtobacterium sp. Leaf261]|uniref:hypothetical protein n=1 Tax=Curtobacterium sp. Leaf261 TaxID=1736311 RepID=UPI0006F6C507|nr:hypothetical protein [Curtobacterium sp. Leaf261]KQO63483.1 hypothetical protein ASF23_04320 [Curtobacterium sp. Leaf261]